MSLTSSHSGHIVSNTLLACFKFLKNIINSLLLCLNFLQNVIDLLSKILFPYIFDHKLFICNHKLVSLLAPSVLRNHNILYKLDMTQFLLLLVEIRIHYISFEHNLCQIFTSYRFPKLFITSKKFLLLISLNIDLGCESMLNQKFMFIFEFS